MIRRDWWNANRTERWADPTSELTLATIAGSLLRSVLTIASIAVRFTIDLLLIATGFWIYRQRFRR
jgi:hypothetical protein